MRAKKIDLALRTKNIFHRHGTGTATESDQWQVEHSLDSLGRLNVKNWRMTHQSPEKGAPPPKYIATSDNMGFEWNLLLLLSNISLFTGANVVTLTRIYTASVQVADCPAEQKQLFHPDSLQRHLEYALQLYMCYCLDIAFGTKLVTKNNRAKGAHDVWGSGLEMVEAVDAFSRHWAVVHRQKCGEFCSSVVIGDGNYKISRVTCAHQMSSVPASRVAPSMGEIPIYCRRMPKPGKTYCELHSPNNPHVLPSLNVDPMNINDNTGPVNRCQTRSARDQECERYRCEISI